jgi:acyl-coenzyme A synthetase/AMP-(fatty) acid ligase
MGKPSPGFDLQVVDGDGNPLGPNMEGDIAVRVKPERPVGPQTIIPVPSPLKQYMEKCTRYPYSVWIEMLKRKNTASVMVLPS